MKLCDYIENLWQEGDTKAWAADAISGMMHFVPQLRGQLRGAGRLMKAWGTLELPDRAPPLTTGFVTALAGAALSEGSFRMCVILLLGFHALLRTGELLQVRAQHIVFQAGHPTALLTLPTTKSGQRLRNVPESVTITDPTLLDYLAVLLPRLWPGELIFPGGDHAFRVGFPRICQSAHLPALDWKPYSLRRGGATAHFLQYGSLDRTAIRGRWQNQRTARIYIDEGVAILAGIRATTQQEKHIRRLANLVVEPKNIRSVGRQGTLAALL